MEITNVWKLNNISVVIGHQKLPGIHSEYRFNHNYLKSVAKSNTVTNVSYSTQIPRTCPLTSGDRMNFLLLTEHNYTDSLGYVKVSQQTDDKKCDLVNNNITWPAVILQNNSPI